MEKRSPLSDGFSPVALGKEVFFRFPAEDAKGAGFFENPRWPEEKLPVDVKVEKAGFAGQRTRKNLIKSQRRIPEIEVIFPGSLFFANQGNISNLLIKSQWDLFSIGNPKISGKNQRINSHTAKRRDFFSEICPSFFRAGAVAKYNDYNYR